MASEINQASEKYFKRVWKNYVPEKFKYWITLSYRAGVMWQRKKSIQEKQELIDKMNIFIRSRLPRVIDTYYNPVKGKTSKNVLNEDIREELYEYLISKQ